LFEHTDLKQSVNGSYIQIYVDESMNEAIHLKGYDVTLYSLVCTHTLYFTKTENPYTENACKFIVTQQVYRHALINMHCLLVLQ